MDIKVQFFKTLASTNEKAIQLIDERKASEGELIITDNQFKGRGHQDNKWESEPGKNLTFSLIIQPVFLNASEQFILNEVVGLSIIEALNKSLAEEKFLIKWPNDIYVRSDKIAGVLIQHFLKGTKLNFSIIGIGININQTHFISDAPNPVSLKIITGKTYNKEDILIGFIKSFEQNYEKIKTLSGRNEIYSSYLENLYKSNKVAKFKDKNGLFYGKIKGINEFGQLQISDETGQIRIYGFKELEWL